MIPKIVHQIWIGSSPLPKRCNVFIDSVKSNFNEYEYIWWDDLKVENFLKEFFPKVYLRYSGFNNNAEKADIARYCILHKFGGFYFDIDYECYQCFRKIKNFETFNLFVFYDDSYFKNSFGLKNVFTNSVIGASPENIFLKQLIDSVLSEVQYRISKKLHVRELDKIDDTICKTGPILFTQVFQRIKNHSDVFIGSNDMFVDKNNKKNRFGQHHCLHTWL